MQSYESPREKAEEYLGVSNEFRLGDLPTEQSHPESRNLSRLALVDLSEAIRILKRIDDRALEVLPARLDRLRLLAERIQQTLESGHDVYLCGCGATGRLSLTIETLWRQQKVGTPMENRVFSFMAGGDVALIKSIEGFEDFPEHAERQLVEAGFGAGDLLISCTEGGETPWVIGATEKALELSENPPFFLYCNPDDVLSRTVERSRRVIENERIEKICLSVGPMAITGSTRMQSSTVLMAAVGVCLLTDRKSPQALAAWIDEFIRLWRVLEVGFLDAFIARECEIYRQDEFVLYEADPDFGISVLTDTTERAPTFSLLPFESVVETERALSWCYLYFPAAVDSSEAWQMLLRREPRTLEWRQINGIASMNRLLGFDFSAQLLTRRSRRSTPDAHHRFHIEWIDEGIRFQLDELSHHVKLGDVDRLTRHLVLKMLLNSLSTLIMGRLGRYQGNVMTWVRASNNKLVDRAIRFVELLLGSEGGSNSYSEICYRVFEFKEKLPEDEALVLAVVDSFRSQQARP